MVTRYFFIHLQKDMVKPSKKPFSKQNVAVKPDSKKPAQQPDSKKPDATPQSKVPTTYSLSLSLSLSLSHTHTHPLWQWRLDTFSSIYRKALWNHQRSLSANRKWQSNQTRKSRMRHLIQRYLPLTLSLPPSLPPSTQTHTLCGNGD